MARKISETAGDVHVQDPESGQFVVLHPGDEVPANLDKLVGDHCTEGRRSRVKAAEPAGPGQTPETVARAKAAQEKADAEGDTSGGETDDEKAEREKAEADQADAAKREADEKAKADADALAKAEQAEKARAARGSK